MVVDSPSAAVRSKAAGALIGIDDVEVFHHEQVSGTGYLFPEIILRNFT